MRIPAFDAAYVLGAAVGAAVFGGIGALIGSQVSRWRSGMVA
jgi:hypothetical protein